VVSYSSPFFFPFGTLMVQYALVRHTPSGRGWTGITHPLFSRPGVAVGCLFLIFFPFSPLFRSSSLFATGALLLLRYGEQVLYTKERTRHGRLFPPLFPSSLSPLFPLFGRHTSSSADLLWGNEEIVSRTRLDPRRSPTLSPPSPLSFLFPVRHPLRNSPFGFFCCQKWKIGRRGPRSHFPSFLFSWRGRGGDWVRTPPSLFFSFFLSSSDIAHSRQQEWITCKKQKI